MFGILIFSATKNDNHLSTIPNKPAKYGLKIVMLCDVSTKYMLNDIPYLGNQSSTEAKGMMLDHYFTKKTISALLQ